LTPLFSGLASPSRPSLGTYLPSQGDLGFVLSSVAYPDVLRLLVCCISTLALLSAGHGVVRAEPEAASMPVPPAPGTEVADFAEQYVGSPYRWGGATPAGFDCSGFVMWVYSQFGVDLPHNEIGQLNSGPRIGPDDLEPGDVLVFSNTYRSGLSHTGIYVGDGRFVHAADERHGVVISNLWDGYWGPRLVGASRALG
jgi:cell wall-associated NlpC family hydrolase